MTQITHFTHQYTCSDKQRESHTIIPDGGGDGIRAGNAWAFNNASVLSNRLCRDTAAWFNSANVADTSAKGGGGRSLTRTIPALSLCLLWGSLNSGACVGEERTAGGGGGDGGIVDGTEAWTGVGILMGTAIGSGERGRADGTDGGRNAEVATEVGMDRATAVGGLEGPLGGESAVYGDESGKLGA